MLQPGIVGGEERAATGAGAATKIALFPATERAGCPRQWRDTAQDDAMHLAADVDIGYVETPNAWHCRLALSGCLTKPPGYNAVAFTHSS